ncbi:tetratricopeptide repeat protein [Pseudanabaena sp. ABRG5-3]|uniref:tetratricopeptide repeat protein n=1 Tax=Pseudanabaena sp. ABRG5-3 TaxID=685565 RepID=UPI000DC6DD8A|nr:tetratricopeptide repeat protein [Pseudanabaena sp. ABRG5-3]BBC26877.1 fkpA gene product [Pseudanabaena sp. ABRG5-3]
MLKDAQGLAVNTVSEVAITAINSYTEQCLGYGNRAEFSILAAVAADPKSVLANTFTAAYYLTQENKTDFQQAIPYLQQAKAYLAQANEREKLHFWATEAWANKKIDRAIAYCEEIVARYPQDLLAVQQGQYHYFYQGDRSGLTSIAGAVLNANVGNHYLMGMLAFGLEQSHKLAEAERLARFALEINRADPWAQHAVAHVMETQGRYREGITWMQSFADTWENCNSMLYTHNWWHVALFYLADGEISKALTIYDTHIWGKAQKSSPKDQVGAISLLMRLELLGIDVGNRWQQLSFHLHDRLHEHALPFQDLHYVYALARAGQLHLVTEMLVSMNNYAQNIPVCSQKTWQDVAIPIARGAIAHAIYDWRKAVKELKPVIHRLHEVGGSNTQRKLFEQIYQDANQELATQIARRTYVYPQAIAS